MFAARFSLFEFVKRPIKRAAQKKKLSYSKLKSLVAERRTDANKIYNKYAQPKEIRQRRREDNLFAQQQ